MFSCFLRSLLGYENRTLYWHKQDVCFLCALLGGHYLGHQDVIPNCSGAGSKGGGEVVVVECGSASLCVV